MSSPLVHRIPLPNPYFEGEINVWLIDTDPLTLIDAGLGNDESLQALKAGLAEHGRKLADVRRLILTHRHPDHIGLASHILEESNAEVFVHANDWLQVTQLEKQSASLPDRLTHHLSLWGVPTELITHVARFFVEAPLWATSVPATAVNEGHTFPSAEGDLVVHHTPGHTSGSMSIQFQNHFFCGDHVLQRISPNVGAAEFGTERMLTRYLDSLEKTIHLDAVSALTACPGHGPAFSGLGDRCRWLIHHHHEREEKILSWLTDHSPATVYEVASYLFGEMPTVHLMLGTGEAYVHLEKLRNQGDLDEPSPGTFQRV